MYPQMNSYYYQPPVYQQGNPFSINGKVVDDFNTINANDVPMSGISVFPKSDLSEVVLKRWTPQGTIQTLVYKSFTDNLMPQTTNVSTNAETSPYDEHRLDIQGLNDMLSEINSKLDKLMPTTSKKGATNEPKSNS